MASDIYVRPKIFIDGAILTAEQLNAELDYIKDTGLEPTGIGDASANAVAMQSTADPGEDGSESLPTDLLGEIKRLRKILAELSGKTHWYESPSTDIETLLNDTVTFAGNKSFSGIVSVDNTTQSTSPTTGSLHTDGGLGVAKNAFFGGNVTISAILSNINTTESTSPTTGAINTLGGLGVTKASVLGGGVQTDGINTLKTKIIDIGDWDMDSFTNVNIVHGLSLANIRTVTALIRNDANSTYTILTDGKDLTDGEAQGLIGSIGSIDINLVRLASGVFDSVNFSATSFNRGWITITYIA